MNSKTCECEYPSVIYIPFEVLVEGVKTKRLCKRCNKPYIGGFYNEQPNG